MEGTIWIDWWISYTRNKPRVVPTFVALVSRTFSTFFFQIYIFKSYYILLLLSRSVVVWLFVTQRTAAHQVSLFFTISWSLLKLMSIESVMPSNHLSLCCPLLLLPSVLPSIRVFSSELALHIRWPKYWSIRFSISPSSEYSGVIFLGFTGMISLLPKGLSRVFSNTIVRKHQFFGDKPTFWSSLTSINDSWKNRNFDYTDVYWPTDVSAF